MVIGGVGHADRKQQAMESIEAAPGVESVMSISDPFKFVSREYRQAKSTVKVNGWEIGGPEFIVFAGPCSVEHEEQILTTAECVKTAGAHILRGGAFKPRTSPYDFQGLEEEGLKLLQKAKERTGLAICTEVMSPMEVSLVAEYSDIMQVGARNMQNFNLLKRLGKVNRPVMLKRGLSSTIKEFLLSAEYIVTSGNPNVFLCERGIRTFETFTRNTLDLSAVPLPGGADPPAGHCGPKPWHRQTLARSCYGPCCGRLWRRRADDRGAPQPGTSLQRRPTVSPPPSVRAIDEGLAALH